MGSARLDYGETAGREACKRIVMGQATAAALALAARSSELVDATVAFCQDSTNWIWNASSTAVDPTGLLVQTPYDAPVTGRWVRASQDLVLKLAVDFTKVDAAVLFTVPVGFRLRLRRPLWEVTTPWTGGVNSTIGLSSSNAAYATKGDLLGGAAGDAAAVLIVASPGPFVGAGGTKIVSAAAPVVLAAGDTILFNRIASAFTAGAGFAHIPAELLP